MPVKVPLTARFVPTAGAPYNMEQAQIVGETLEGMAARGLPVTPEVIVEEARPKSAPLHGLFEWDDRVAAESHRRHQARQIVNHLQIVLRDGETVAFAKSYYSVKLELPETEEGEEEEETAPARQYVPVLHVQAAPLLREQVYQNALRELRSWADRYEPLGFDGLEKVIAAVRRMAK